MKRILITGAGGNLGGKLVTHWRETADHELILLDRVVTDIGTQADISIFSADWAQLFAGINVVIHLAGQISPASPWQQVHPANIVGTANILRAAKDFGVSRVVFASTNQVMGGYRFRSERIDSESPPLPLNPYAFSKLIGEELGRAFAAETGADFIVFRIGNIWPGANPPGPELGIGSWGQDMWLSNRDFVHAMDCAVAAPPLGFGIFNLVSDNPGMRWNIEPARRLLGYAPLDGSAPVFTPDVIAEDERARAAVLIPGSWLDQHSRRLDI